MTIFILLENRASPYPVLGCYSTLKLAREEAAKMEAKSPECYIYEETLDVDMVEPVYHSCTEGSK